MGVVKLRRLHRQVREAAAGHEASLRLGGVQVNFWFTLSAYGKAPAGTDTDRYDWAISVVARHVNDRVNRCFAGAAWLKQRFPARSYVRVHLMPRDDASVSVEYLRKKNWGGPKELLCGLRIPSVWFADRSDALMGLREFQAVLHALRAIGDRYGIGLPAAIGREADRGKPELHNPFVARPPEPLRYADSAVELEHLAGSMHPDQLLIAAKEPMPATAGDQRQTIAEALGPVVNRRSLGPADAEVAAWIIRTRQ
jgi:hypothetical protein